jgi:hypothetical protein
MNADQYLAMCEQMGWEPKEEEMPIEVSSLSFESQQSLILLNCLPDKWEGMSGSWMGKDYSGLSAIMDIYEIEDRRRVFELLQIGENELGKHYSQKKKEQEAMSKAKKGR